MRHVPQPRRLLGAVLVAAVAALAPVGAAAAAPSPSPGPAQEQTPGPTKHDHADKPKAQHEHEHAKPEHDKAGRAPTPTPTPSPSPTPTSTATSSTTASPTPSAIPSAIPSATPSDEPAVEPAVLGPTAPARPSPPALRVLSGRTLGALSYDDAVALPAGRPTGRVPAVQGPPMVITWPPHDRPDWPTVATSVRSVVDHPTAPLLMGGLIGLFLLVQSRLDRHDPKLTRDPGRYPPDLRFGPAIRSPGPVR